MTKEILTSESLVEIHENLNEFAAHHQNLGGQKAHKLIKGLMEEQKLHEDETGFGYNQAIERVLLEVLSVLHKTFVP